uniref:Uncharacterized protein n=1 Tax=Chromera velia CCMP2878 TaxID=1169474 RepID=A0A0G4IE81_9ALVE|eukprot:Cvel_13595.t1-p1 / transcript=Cvel_13595.t1 / gene=Cvel_13595 / organism=Chromera_velia_CCMP2878 / gene_product=hypothetical protein / transcript_product=hypothetical protein / location=Cvel_scaffold935:42866-45951(-) / protein_length=397 / sequence_SO=supercontig / SO=protein_coding / is_pseudo=false
MDDGGRKPKARFFAKGFLDGRLVNTYVGTPSITGINTVCLFIVSTGIKMGAADVTAAFLTSKDHNAEQVSATLPSVLPQVPEENPFKNIPDKKYEELKKMVAEYEPGGTYLVEMGFYGLPCAAQLFDYKLEGVCKELGFKRVDTAIAVKALPEGGRAQAIIMNWIDDLLTKTPLKEHKVLQETLNKRLGFRLDSVCMIGEGSERKFLRKFSRVDISRVSTGEIHLLQVLYLKNIDTAPLWEILKEKRPNKLWKGLDGKSAEPSTEEEVDSQYKKPIRTGRQCDEMLGTAINLKKALAIFWLLIPLVEDCLDADSGEMIVASALHFQSGSARGVLATETGNQLLVLVRHRSHLYPTALPPESCGLNFFFSMKGTQGCCDQVSGWSLMGPLEHGNLAPH